MQNSQMLTLGLVVARGSHRETLRGGNLLGGERIAGRELRQQTLALLGSLLLIRRLGVELEETVETDHLTLGYKLVLRAVDLDRDGRTIQLGRHHLRGNGALPDQVVETFLGRCTLNRLTIDVRRTNRLMSLLGALALGLVVEPTVVLLAKVPIIRM